MYSIDSEEFILAMRLERVRQLPLEDRLKDLTLVDLVPNSNNRKTDDVREEYPA